MTGRFPGPATSRWVGIGIPLTIFFAALVPRLLLVSYLGVQPEGDYLAYHVMAKSFVGGDGLIDVFGNRAYYNPGYPLLILAPVYGLFGVAPNFAQIANAFLGAISGVLLYFVAWDLLRHRGWAIFAALLFAVHVESIAYAEYLAKENLTVPLLLGAILAALRAKTSQMPSIAWIAAGIVMGAALLTGTSSIWLGPSLLLIAVAQRGWGAALTRSAPALALGAAVLIAPWIARNQAVLGAPVFSTSGGFNLYLGNNPSATGEFVSIADTPMAGQWHELRREGEVVADRAMRARALAFIYENPSTTILLFSKKLSLLWAPPFHHLQTEGVSRSEFILRLAWLIQYLALAAGTCAALVLLFFRKRGHREIWAIGIGLFGFTLVHMGVYVILRYRVPVMPFLIILTSFALSWAISSSRKSAP